MMTLEETEEALARLVQDLPQEIFEELNGGVLLKEEAKLHPGRLSDDLFILGEYHRDRIFGRYVVIYYGSLEKAFGHLPKEEFRAELDRVLKHELTHHLENRAGERDLELEDQETLLHYYLHHPQNRRSQG